MEDKDMYEKMKKELLEAVKETLFILGTIWMII